MHAPPGESPLGLYIHIPFCRKRCKFCYFKVFTEKNASEIENYVAALAREMELVSQLPVMGQRPFRFVYFGGGTPSFLSARQLTSLVDRLRRNVAWDAAEEVTFECEPGTLSEPKVRTIRELGVTRLSLGIENFSDDGAAGKRPSTSVGRNLSGLGVDHGSRVSERQYRFDCRHGRRDLGELEREHPADDRAVSRQRDDLPTGTAVQHGLFAEHSRPAGRSCRWPIGRPNEPGSITRTKS